MVPVKGDKKSKAERAAERKKEQIERAAYLGTLSDKVLGEIEKVFEETTPTPTGNDMIDVLAFTSIFMFARQIRMSCNSKKTMKSVMKSTIWALTNQIVSAASPLLNDDEAWDDITGEEGGNDGSDKG